MLIGIPEVMDVSKGEDTVRQKITPYLWFDDNAEEVINFYVSIFKNSEIFHIQHYTEAGPRVPGTVLAISFRLDGQEFEAINDGPLSSSPRPFRLPSTASRRKKSMSSGRS